MPRDVLAARGITVARGAFRGSCAGRESSSFQDTTCRPPTSRPAGEPGAMQTLPTAATASLTTDQVRISHVLRAKSGQRATEVPHVPLGPDTGDPSPMTAQENLPSGVQSPGSHGRGQWPGPSQRGSLWAVPTLPTPRPAGALVAVSPPCPPPPLCCFTSAVGLKENLNPSVMLQRMWVSVVLQTALFPGCRFGAWVWP